MVFLSGLVRAFCQPVGKTYHCLLRSRCLGSSRDAPSPTNVSGEKRCVTTQKAAAKETSINIACNAAHAKKVSPYSTTIADYKGSFV